MDQNWNDLGNDECHLNAITSINFHGTYFLVNVLNWSLTRERLLNELRETEEASRRQAEVLVKVGLAENALSKVK